MRNTRDIAIRKAVGDGRSSPRHSVSASAEIVEPRSRTRLICRATDLSMGGCYLDTVTTFEVGTAVHLRLISEGRTFQAEALVLYANPGMGMGLAFSKMTPEHLEVLSEWMRVLGQETPEPELAGESMFDFGETAKSAAPVESVREIVSCLIALLARKNVLTDLEAEELRKKLSRNGD